MPAAPDPQKRQCTLLLFVATSTEEDALKDAATHRGIPFEKVKDPELRQYGWGEYHWLGPIGSEIVIAVRPTREKGNAAMGALGRLGVAAKAMRFRLATGAKGIVQLGMAFGIDPQQQSIGDVLVSSCLIPYDNRDIKPAPDGHPGYVADYSRANREQARSSLVELFRRELKRGGHPFSIHIGAMLSGAARIHCRAFRDELVAGVPGGEDPIVGGEMEGVGLLAASTAADDPIWCVVKGLSDFGDEGRDEAIKTSPPTACRNAAEPVLSSLLNDVRA
jgi:adenosylhomocysteine nucleosidase